MNLDYEQLNGIIFDFNIVYYDPQLYFKYFREGRNLGMR